MHRASCRYCCFYERCGDGGVCEHYYPVGERADEIRELRAIEDGRARFRKEYLEYLEAFYE